MSDVRITDHGLFALSRAIEKLAEAMTDAACIAAHMSPEQIRIVYDLVETRDRARRT